MTDTTGKELLEGMERLERTLATILGRAPGLVETLAVRDALGDQVAVLETIAAALVRVAKHKAPDGKKLTTAQALDACEYMGLDGDHVADHIRGLEADLGNARILLEDTRGQLDEMSGHLSRVGTVLLGAFGAGHPVYESLVLAVATTPAAVVELAEEATGQVVESGRRLEEARRIETEAAAEAQEAKSELALLRAAFKCATGRPAEPDHVEEYLRESGRLPE